MPRLLYNLKVPIGCFRDGVHVTGVMWFTFPPLQDCGSRDKEVVSQDTGSHYDR